MILGYAKPLNMSREYIATVTLPKKGGTQTVTVYATCIAHAKEKLLRMGYVNPRNIT